MIRATTEAQDGAIRGTIEPAQKVSISVYSGQDEVTTTSSDDEGAFLIRGLSAGTYRLLFDGPGTAPAVEKEGVDVRLGEVTDLGSIAVED